MKTKGVLHSFSPFVFTWPGAKKAIYAWTDSLSHPKNGFY
ncbi:hypothetical protein EMIT019CA3_120011 [Bacillus pseudomycoides]|nr:hypothetical protein bmyco0003_7660 [Bacillus pseudomycoides]